MRGPDGQYRDAGPSGGLPTRRNSNRLKAAYVHGGMGSLVADSRGYGVVKVSPIIAGKSAGPPHGSARGTEEGRPLIAPGSPTVRRRRLAAELRAIRESRGKSGDAVAAALKWSASKISRYERARTSLRPKEVERLLDYYQITGSRREQLLGLAQDAAQKGWWEEFGDSLTEDYQQFIGLEYEASSMSIWHVGVVTGLLQPKAHARHIISSPNRVEPVPPGVVGRMVNVRMRRQRVLEREGLQVTVVLDESVLRRRVGNDSVMFEQLQRLAREAEKPNVTL